MSLWKYKYFVDVVDCKSFTKAGQINFVSQTAISQQISSLEKSIGGRLIERRSGDLLVTEMGRIVYERAKEMLAIDEKMRRDIEELKERHIIRIGVDSSINKRLWARIQTIIDLYYTEEEFRFSKIDYEIANRMLHEQRLDAYIGYDLAAYNKNSGILESPLVSSRVGFFVGEDTTIPRREVYHLSDLDGHVRYGTRLYPVSVRDYDCGQEKLAPIELVGNADTMKIKVEFNDGYCLVDNYYYSRCVGEVRFLEECEESCTLCYFYRTSNPGTVKFLERLQEILRESPRQA